MSDRGSNRRRRIVWGVIAAALALPVIVWAYESGPPARSTAAPGDDPLACATALCHTGLPNGGPINSGGGGVTATFSSGSTYTPGGSPITITVTVTDPVNTHYGFQMTARPASNLSNGQAGSFTATPGQPQLVFCDNSSPRPPGGCPANDPVQFISHAYPAGTHVGTTPYTFTWTPPSTNIGNVHFYVAGNSVNNNLLADSGDHVYTNSYVLTPAAACTLSTPTVTSVISGSSYGAFPNFAAGSWIEVYGSNLATDQRIWGGTDFSGSNAPISLDGTSVSINGQQGFIYFISSGQLNVQAPADMSVGPVAVTVTNCGGTSAPMTAQKVALAPGMLAPASFNVGGKQYMVGLFQDGVTYVGNTGLSSGLTFKPAAPGTVITAYGIGFGPVTPTINPGIVVSTLNNLTNSFSLNFGSSPAKVTYSGLAPNFVGLYQFNITVPQVANGDYPITFLLNGQASTQTMYLTVHN